MAETRKPTWDDAQRALRKLADNATSAIIFYHYDYAANWLASNKPPSEPEAAAVGRYPLPVGVPLSLGCIKDGACRQRPCICAHLAPAMPPQGAPKKECHHHRMIQHCYECELEEQERLKDGLSEVGAAIAASADHDKTVYLQGVKDERARCEAIAHQYCWLPNIARYVDNEARKILLAIKKAVP